MDRYDIPPPAGWDDFEDLCRDLWAVLWEDPDTRKHGRRGQPQAGVDIYGRPQRGAQWSGVQCKLKSQIAGTRLTRAEILREVKKARTFKPALVGFTLATTAVRDVAVEAIVRKLAAEQLARGSFSVSVSFWDDILDALKGHEGLLRRHYERWRHSAEGPSISIAKLPATGKTFVAREEELARLDAGWEGGTNVISFVAMGGAGKSALVNRWLGGMQRDGWRGAERVLGWSFYSQGTDAAGASSEAFTEYALDWLGYKGEPITSPWEKGEVLAGLLRETRTLLLLDGLEPLQHPPGAQSGRIKDPAVQALVKELAAENPGLCVITTRLAVADVAGKVGTETVDLDKLPAAAGAELLRQFGVEGSEKDLQAASDELRGHGLALTLLGTYLRDVCDGDVRRRREAAVLDAEIEGSEHARRVMAAYESWLGLGAALQVLRLLGLFDRPADAAALAALRAEPEIPELTVGIGVGEEKAWKLALARLRRARLVAPPESHYVCDQGALDAHPLVREYFGEGLRQGALEAWRAGNERLYEHYQRGGARVPGNPRRDAAPLCRCGPRQPGRAGTGGVR
ncbi:MAG TPA: hypothetical protein VNJ70_15625 [Thermoanaerobaculia bacterium]|nr:hypothetical protein [Thermoanaerobaculia bacterium]